eukprot:Gb_24660 [translate_table: standard]
MIGMICNDMDECEIMELLLSALNQAEHTDAVTPALNRAPVGGLCRRLYELYYACWDYSQCGGAQEKHFGAPLTILGSFDEFFLELPSNVLTTVMRKHQRYFPIEDASSGKLLPAFIAVGNGRVDKATVRRGNEAILRARYGDAKFFYQLDTRKPLVEFREQLKGILFQEKLGSMLDKTKRIEEMLVRLSAVMGLEEDKLLTAQSAAAVAMSDLVTAMVTEFTSLAGIMGHHYALREGYSRETAEAIFERVLPRFSGDNLPKNTSYGLVQVLIENQKNLDLTTTLQIAADIQPLHVPPSVINDMHLFVTRRLEQLLVDQGINVEIITSVLSERADMPCLATFSVVQMETLIKDDTFKKVVEAYSRPTKIIRGKNVDPAFQVDEALFEIMDGRRLT